MCECSVLSGGSGRDLFALARQHRFDEQQRIGSDGCQSSRFAEWKPTLPFTEQHSWRAQRHPRAPRHQRSQQPRLLPTHPLVSYNFYNTYCNFSETPVKSGLQKCLGVYLKNIQQQKDWTRIQFVWKKTQNIFWLSRTSFYNGTVNLGLVKLTVGKTIVYNVCLALYNKKVKDLKVLTIRNRS